MLQDSENNGKSRHRLLEVEMNKQEREVENRIKEKKSKVKEHGDNIVSLRKRLIDGSLTLDYVAVRQIKEGLDFNEKQLKKYQRELRNYTMKDEDMK
jgi:hypothetical protein